MSELAFNANGDSFDIPATVTGWRVRRMKPRGAPELVYGKDGRPLTINIDADIDELREAVGSAGRYRLDPINDDAKCVENVPAAYVQVVKPQRNADPTTALATIGPSDDAIREAMRLNTELARSVIDRFPEMMTAAAELLRAADGAGLPARQPRALDDDESDEDVEHPDAKPGFDLNAFVAQIIPMVVMGLGNGKMPQLAEVLDWRKAAPTSKAKTSKLAKPARPDGPGDVIDAAAVPENATDVLPPIDPQTMAHFIAVQSALTPEEAAIAREVAKELSAAELRTWFDELSKLSVPDAVEKVRKLISGFGKAGGAS